MRPNDMNYGELKRLLSSQMREVRRTAKLLKKADPTNNNKGYVHSNTEEILRNHCTKLLVDTKTDKQNGLAGYCALCGF